MEQKPANKRQRAREYKDKILRMLCETLEHDLEHADVIFMFGDENLEEIRRAGWSLLRQLRALGSKKVGK